MSAMCVTGVQRPTCVKTHAIKRCTRFDPIYILLPSPPIYPPKENDGCWMSAASIHRRETRRVPLRSSTSNVGHSRCALCTRYSFFSFSRYAFALDNEQYRIHPSFLPFEDLTQHALLSRSAFDSTFFFFPPFFFAKLIDLSATE